MVPFKYDVADGLNHGVQYLLACKCTCLYEFIIEMSELEFIPMDFIYPK